MKNFRINPEGWREPAPEPHWYNVGAKVLFVKFLDSEPFKIQLKYAI